MMVELGYNFEDSWEYPVVWLKEYRTFGQLLSMGAHTATIVFDYLGEQIQEQIENEDWEYWNDYATDYEEE